MVTFSAGEGGSASELRRAIRGHAAADNGRQPRSDQKSPKDQKFSGTMIKVHRAAAAPGK
jgi:hypothetical protein